MGEWAGELNRSSDSRTVRAARSFEISKSRNLEDVKTGRLENAKLKDSGRLARLE
ncbi:hypothetical protein BUH_6092 [Burkholderia pseudomallei Pakistan 9]|nr:hypothetical protein BUH_6092 [Burkholderia pseudomallei Pakistan 9]